MDGIFGQMAPSLPFVSAVRYPGIARARPILPFANDVRVTVFEGEDNGYKAIGQIYVSQKFCPIA